MHTCPDCGQACYCNGDIDDIEINSDEAAIHCRHYVECESQDEDADDELLEEAIDCSDESTRFY